MLDENLPTFFLQAPTKGKKEPRNDSTFYYTQYGSEPEPAYTLRRPEPSLPGSKNRYAAALYDSFSPDILYAEVLLVPEWTQPTLSAEAIRLNGGVAPAPEPVLPTEFVIQLYNPDQQITVKQARGGWVSAPTWEFAMPQETFRQPSASTLDRGRHDPSVSEVTPKILFKWRKDSKFNKDLVCFHSGKVLDSSKKKHKEPDITVALFKGQHEVTLYEPNLQRVDLEDPKGFEVVLLLGAIIIRDVYFGQIRETFNVAETRPTSPPSAAVTGLYNANPNASFRPPRSSHPTTSTNNVAAATKPKPSRPPRVPPTDPRSQWEIDAETARLRAATEAEAKERARREAVDQKRVKKLLESEEKEKRRKQVEVDKETERLKRIYGKDDAKARPLLPPRHSVPNGASYQDPYLRPASHPQGYHPQRAPGHSSHGPRPSHGGRPPQGGPGPYLAAPGGYANPAASTSNLNPYMAPRLKNKSSFFGFGKKAVDERDQGRLQKKKSSMF
ncbi:MAG: hypothetical protein Q9160_000812 [Pyrenula sp. 1 TL-2023]